MISLKFLVIDDDKKFSEKFSKIIHRFFYNHSVNLKIECLNDNFNNYDPKDDYLVVFIDIDLIEGNGINLVKKFEKDRFYQYIVYVSSRENLVFDSLITQPLYFIRKSNLEKDSLSAFRLIKERIKEPTLYIFKYKGREHLIAVDKINYIEINDHKAIIYTKNNNCILYKTLNQIMTDISQNYIVQVHKSFAINLNFISNIEKSTITLTNGIEIPLGKKYKENFMKLWRDFLYDI